MLSVNKNILLGKRKVSFPEPGAFVAVYHPDDFVLSIDGTFLGPKQTTYFAVGFVYRIQKQDFPKIQCLHRSGLETYNFTGQPFQTEYHVEGNFSIALIHFFLFGFEIVSKLSKLGFVFAQIN